LKLSKYTIILLCRQKYIVDLQYRGWICCLFWNVSYTLRLSYTVIQWPKKERWHYSVRSEIATTVFINLETFLDVSAPPKCQQLIVDTAYDPRRHESLVEIYLVCPHVHMKVLANDRYTWISGKGKYICVPEESNIKQTCILALTHAGFLSDN